MAASDFLFNGKAPSSVTKYGTSTNNLPAWYSDYQKGILAKGNAIAAQPYQAYGAQRVAGMTGDQEASFANTRDNMGNWAPQLNAANATAANAANISAYGAGAGALNAASGTWNGQSAQQYMSPYIDNVVDRIGQLGQRNLTERLLPSVNDTFVRAGQMGSTRMIGQVGNAVRDMNESIMAQQNEALNQGYTNAQTQFAADQNRLASIGQTQGNLASADAQNQNSIAKTQAAFAQQLQSQGLTDNAALQANGALQQALDQKNLDTAYGDFVEQRDYPKQQVAFLSDVLHGVGNPGSQTTSTYTAPLSNSYQPSGLAQIAGSLSTAGALSKLLG